MSYSKLKQLVEYDGNFPEAPAYASEEEEILCETGELWEDVRVFFNKTNGHLFSLVTNKSEDTAKGYIYYSLFVKDKAKEVRLDSNMFNRTVELMQMSPVSCVNEIFKNAGLKLYIDNIHTELPSDTIARLFPQQGEDNV